MFGVILQKLKGIFSRVWLIIYLLPLRIGRLLRHIFLFDPKHLQVQGSWYKKVGFWLLDIMFYILDILGVPDWYELVCDWSKFNSRKLTKEEIQLGQSVFGDAIAWHRVRIDATARIGSKSRAIAYVSFNIINTYNHISKSTFIHELVHVWQYQRLGSVYISRALMAQRSKEGYNYGGLRGLQGKASIWDFNFEQQGDVVSDYYRISEGLLPEWGQARQQNMSDYQTFINEIRGDIA